MLLDRVDFEVWQSAENFDENLLIGSDSTHGFFDLFAVEIQNWCQQGDKESLEVASRLRLNIFDQILAKVGLEDLRDFLQILSIIK